MKNDVDLQKDVIEAIRWEPLLGLAEIGVIAKDGIVTLTGVVDSYSKKLEAEHAAKNVTGVKAVVEKIEISYIHTDRKSDTDIVSEILHAYSWNWAIPNNVIKIKVEQGWVTLEGEIQWNYQREAAKKAIENLIGVVGVSNNIKIKSDAVDTVEKAAIERALERNWSINDKDIEVKVARNSVTLTGKVYSLYQKEEAGRIAWNAPGVWSVDNELVIRHDF